MGSRPLKRAIQRYIEDPLADFVLRSQVPEGSTVVVDREEGGDREGAESAEVKLSVLEPAPQPTPVGVGAEGGSDEADVDEATQSAQSTDES